MLLTKHLLLFFFSVSTISGSCSQNTQPESGDANEAIILPGAYNTINYVHLLRNKKVGLVANHTSFINKTHLADSLTSLGIYVSKIFAPEHGFRGDQPDGKEISNGKDLKTGIEVISLYGNHKKPSKKDLSDIDIILFDIQDVGVRFYTYLSTLTYVMEACADNNIPLIVLDRPNPNGFYIDGPVLDTAYSSFVGLHPVPVVYGMTIGEYASMVSAEKWLKTNVKCSLTVVKCMNYTHKSRYSLPINPSPNLRDMKAVYLYPSLCFFEGTIVSIGRGTGNPFKVFGHPKLTTGTYTFTPQSLKGISENPPLKGQLCYGQNVEGTAETIEKQGTLELSWLLAAYAALKAEGNFFSGYFDKLAGNSTLRMQIISGMSEKEIRASWQPELEKFRKIRKKYLLYPDFD